ncbi:DUF3375 domain-containing protein [Ktedonobacter robiniae]|uniref:DUF3375 domain-containing protein n=1 Tax=Ktedonobacter robiniae TaxID=2778365 RepID=A0ABQ3UMA8_9CHLR|nr:DUF3375 domain-containing protein [Ktedonobacter robiniae]GHO53747.1 hypothetical protein KSB_22220 [Ktedonobacter robiniae]
MGFDMSEEQLAYTLEHASSIKLLKADSAALIISFLHREFKQAQRVAVPHPEFIEHLEEYLEYLREQKPGQYPGTAQAYIRTWSDSDHRFIHIVAHGNSEVPMVVLTSEAERAIGWLEDMQPRSFVGTESRFLLIVQLIRDLIEKSTDDPDKRLEQLEQQRKDLDQQIEQIYQTGMVEKQYSPTQLRERFIEASNMARQLLRDFRLVEERFRDIARSVQQAQLQPGARKGSLVEYVLDADADLKSSDQGRSFYTFWEFLISPSQRDELKAFLEQLTHLPELRSVLNEERVLPRLSSTLIEAAEKVVHSNARLAEQLRRLLDEQAAAENRRVQALIQDIKREGYRLAHVIDGSMTFLEIEGAPEINLSMERDLWKPEKARPSGEPPLLVSEEDLRDIDLTALYTPFSLDEDMLRARIETLLEYTPQIRLCEVLARYPVEKGLAEILTYCMLAARDARHQIDVDASETIRFSSLAQEDGSVERVLVVPSVLYRRSDYEGE